jgi:hypothetical protein
MNLIAAGAISLDSTFKTCKLFILMCLMQNGISSLFCCHLYEVGKQDFRENKKDKAIMSALAVGGRE